MGNNGGRLRYFKIFLLECNYINMRQVKWNEIYSIWEKILMNFRAKFYDCFATIIKFIS